jgi:hypothetical protein
MEIAPVPGIRALPAVQPRQGDFRPPEVFDVEGPAKPRDGAAQRGWKKAAGAEEEDEFDLMADGEPEAEAGPRQVDLFA